MKNSERKKQVEAEFEKILENWNKELKSKIHYHIVNSMVDLYGHPILKIKYKQDEQKKPQ